MTAITAAPRCPIRQAEPRLRVCIRAATALRTAVSQPAVGSPKRQRATRGFARDPLVSFGTSDSRQHAASRRDSPRRKISAKVQRQVFIIHVASSFPLKPSHHKALNLHAPGSRSATAPSSPSIPKFAPPRRWKGLRGHAGRSRPALARQPFESRGDQLALLGKQHRLLRIRRLVRRMGAPSNDTLGFTRRRQVVTNIDCDAVEPRTQSFSSRNLPSLPCSRRKTSCAASCAISRFGRAAAASRSTRRSYSATICSKDGQISRLCGQDQAPNRLGFKREVAHQRGSRHEISVGYTRRGRKSLRVELADRRFNIRPITSIMSTCYWTHPRECADNGYSLYIMERKHSNSEVNRAGDFIAGRHETWRLYADNPEEWDRRLDAAFDIVTDWRNIHGVPLKVVSNVLTTRR